MNLDDVVRCVYCNAPLTWDSWWGAECTECKDEGQQNHEVKPGGLKALAHQANIKLKEEESPGGRAVQPAPDTGAES